MKNNDQKEVIKIIDKQSDSCKVDSVELEKQYTKEAFLEFPYYFEQEERKAYLQSKINGHYLQNQENKNIEIKKFIIVQQVHSFQNTTETNIIKTWLIDKSRLEIAYSQIGKIQLAKVFQLEKTYSPCTIPSEKIKNLKLDNLVIFGKKDLCNKSITVDLPTISNKHLILSKEVHAQSETKNIINFIHCYWKLKKNKAGNTLLSNLHFDLIKKITKYIGCLEEDKFTVKDNDSSTGSYYFPEKTYPLSKEKKEMLIIQGNDALAFKVENIIKKTKLSDLVINIDYVVANSTQSRLFQICNRSLQIEESMKNEDINGEVLILKAFTPKIKKLYVLYPQETPYVVKVENFDIFIQSKRNQENEEAGFAEIVVTNNKWEIVTTSNESVHYSLKDRVSYGLHNRSCIRLGKETKFIITLNAKSN